MRSRSYVEIARAAPPSRLFVSESTSDFLAWVGDKLIGLLCPMGEVLSRSEALNDLSWARLRRSPGYFWEELARCHRKSLSWPNPSLVNALTLNFAFRMSGVVDLRKFEKGTDHFVARFRLALLYEQVKLFLSSKDRMHDLLAFQRLGSVPFF